jgi:hypothetical protein
MDAHIHKFQGKNMLIIRAGSVAGRRFSVSRLVWASLLVSLSGLAQAQLTVVKQSGTASFVEDNYYTSPSGQNKLSNDGSQSLRDLPFGRQQITAGNSDSPISSRLSTDTDLEWIQATYSLRAGTNYRTIRDANGAALQNVSTAGQAKADVNIAFTVDQGMLIAVTGTKGLSFGGTTQLRLDQIGTDGQVVATFANSAVYDLTSLQVGSYNLSLRGSVSSYTDFFGNHRTASPLDAQVKIQMIGTLPVAAVPEPATAAMLALGGLMLAAAVRRPKR